MDDAARAVGRVSWADWKDVGGVESIEECVCHFLLLSLSSPVVCLRNPEQGIWMVMTFFLCSSGALLDYLKLRWLYGDDERR